MTLNYGYMKIPFKYLGILIGDNPRKQLFWHDVLDKFRKRVSR